MGAQVGIFGNIQEAFGVNPTFSGMTLLNTARNLKTWWNFEDFNVGLTSTLKAGIWGLFASGPGAVSVDGAGTALRPGQAYIAASAVGEWAIASGIYTGVSTYLFGGGVYVIEADIAIINLSTAVDEYCFYFGFGNQAGAESASGVYFKYDRAGFGANWQLTSANGGVRTETDSGVAVAAGGWTRLKVMVNAAGTAADFYINDILVGQNVANIPTLINVTHLFDIVKTVGVAQVSAYIDWAWLWYDLSVSR